MAAALEWHLTGGAANADPNASLGGELSVEEWSAVAMNNLFDDVDWTEAIAGDTEYRALDLVNVGDEAAAAIALWLDPNTSAEDTALALGDGGENSVASVADESTPPAGVSFSEPTPGAKLALADIAPGAYRRVWFRRTVSPLAGNTAEDTATLKWQYA